MSNDYARPDVLVSVEWVANHLDDPAVRLVESNEDILLYATGHIPGAVNIDWHADLNDLYKRDYINSEQFAALMQRNGISPDTTVVFYGDKNNWWATYAFWVFQLFGHRNAKVMNGGRTKWIAEGRELTKKTPSYPPSRYPVPVRDDSKVRAFRDQTLAHQAAGLPLVDVRSPGEYSGQLLHMADYPQEGALRGGHIPGAKNVPWARAAAEDGSFKNADALRTIYLEEQGLDPSQPTVTYCRIGERSSHTWFVLHELLGRSNVVNYDGSWVEYGSLIGVPVER